MTEQTPTDKEFEKYLSGDSDLSALYQKSESQGPNEITDQAILNAAKNQLETHASASQGKYRWHIPATIAAGLITAIIVFQVVPKKEDTIPGPQAQTPATHSQVDAAAKPGAERMLDKIAIHLRNHEQASAEKEYTLFRELFPKYKIDYQKYPELKALD